MRTFFKECFITIRFKEFLSPLFLGIGIIFLVSSIANIAGILYSSAAPKGIVFGKDNDAGRGIQTTMLSEWYKSNHFAPYGNFYYRLGNTIAKFTPADLQGKYSGTEKDEATHHFAALLTSLLCLVGTCLFLGYLLVERWDYSVYIACVLLNLALRDETWVSFMFRVHPEHLLVLMTCIATYFTMRYSRYKETRDFILAGLFWGLGMAVKRSLVLFVPSFLYLFLSEGFNKKSLRTGFQFIGWMLLSYLVIGFPQNFGFIKHIRFLVGESRHSLIGTPDSMMKYLELLTSQSKFLIMAYVPFHFFWGRRDKSLDIKMIIFLLIALVILLSRSMVTSFSHHVMPHVAVILVISLFVIKRLPVLPCKHKTPLLFIFSLFCLYFLRGENETIQKVYAHEMRCIPSANSILEKTKKIQEGNDLILVRDPYFPFSSQRDNHDQIWGITLEDLDQNEFPLVGVTRHFTSQYLGEPYAFLNEAEKSRWVLQKKAAVLFMGEKDFTTPGGKTYRKVAEENCGYLLWERI